MVNLTLPVDGANNWGPAIRGNFTALNSALVDVSAGRLSGDPTGATDSTAAVQALFDAGGDVFVPAGTYVIDSVSVTQSVRVVCAEGVTFRRASGADAASGSYWSAGAAMFEVNAPGLTVEFTGVTYDGNNTNQTATEPTGFFLKTYPTATPGVIPTRVRLTDCRFTNGTSGYLALRGDDSQRRYRTEVTLTRCTFEDTVYGVGKGDPSTPNALGYLPTYVGVYDYVHLTTHDFTATFTNPTGTGQYAPTAILGTFFGTDHATSGRCSIFMHGTTRLSRMGRSAKAYNNDTEWVTNNGIGAVDVYGNGEELYVEHVVADSCQNVPVRAKASLTRYTVKSAVLMNCHRGLQVSPSTTGTSVTTVNVGKVVTSGGTIPQIEFVGTSSADRLPGVSIDAVTVTGPTTNPEGLTTEGAVHLRNVVALTGDGVTVTGSPKRGISVIDVERCALRGVRIDTTTSEGVYVSGSGFFRLSDFTITGTSAIAVSIAGAPVKLDITDGWITSVVDYGVFANTSTSDLTVMNVAVETVTGQSRGFYAAGGDAAFIRNRIGTGVTTALVTGASARKREQHNSWNAAEHRATAAPTTGTWVLGDMVWNSGPASTEPIGWVCTVAGTPGTWAAFGTIA